MTETGMLDVSTYSDEELFEILDLSNPSDRELEAKIIVSIEKYREMNRNDIAHFFMDVYRHFFDTPDDNAQSKEGFEGQTGQTTKPTTTPPAGQPEKAIGGVSQVQMVQYTRSNLNPLLKETISRIASINSIFREDPTNTISTNFVVNLSEPLNNVVELKLTSYQIPYTWYTINNDFGGNFFYIKGNADGINNGDHDYQIQILSGNYTKENIVSAINEVLQNLSVIYPDMNFGNTGITYNSSRMKTTITMDLKKMYNHSNYYLEFPYDPFDVLPGNAQNLARYLGFDYQTYDCISIQSEIDLPLIQQSETDDNINSIYTINTTNYRIQIIQYTITASATTS
jgi:hypothetical protein